MSNLIIHIGLHKTGTTYLQYEYFNSLKDVIYMHGNQFFVPWKEQVSKEKKMMLLSYEGFSGIAWNKESSWIESFEVNIAALKQFFPQAIILITFRKHGDLLLSMYKQYINEGNSCDLNEFYGETGVIKSDDLSFKTRINLLEEYFERVYFLNYESFKAEGTNYYDNLFRKEFSLTRQNNQKHISKSNKSISGPKLELLRKINPIYAKFPRKIRTGLRYFGLSPRDILQNKLKFWNSKDSNEYKKLKDKINKEFTKDWEYFESKQWKN